jgi:hypothetical protein
MSYKYCKIYNVSKSEWAYDISGGDDANKIWTDNRDNRSYFSSTAAIVMMILNILIIVVVGAACFYFLYKSSRAKEDQTAFAAEIKFAVDRQRAMILANSPPPKGELPKVII